jgi:hypothetical protein
VLVESKKLTENSAKLGDLFESNNYGGQDENDTIL